MNLFAEHCRYFALPFLDNHQIYSSGYTLYYRYDMTPDEIKQYDFSITIAFTVKFLRDIVIALN